MESKFARVAFVRLAGDAIGGNSLGSEWLQKPVMSVIFHERYS
jgi:hypothetical protein